MISARLHKPVNLDVGIMDQLEEAENQDDHERI